MKKLDYYDVSKVVIESANGDSVDSVAVQQKQIIIGIQLAVILEDNQKNSNSNLHLIYSNEFLNFPVITDKLHSSLMIKTLVLVDSLTF